MNFELTNNWKKLILVSLGLGLVAIGIFPFTWFAIAAISFLLIVYSSGDKYLIPFTIILFLVMTSDFTESYRNYINIFLILLLVYLYLKNFGLSLSYAIKFPKEINYVLALTLFSMLISSLFSENIPFTLLVTFRQIVFFIIVYIYFSFIKDEGAVSFYIGSLIIVSIVLGAVIFYEIISKGLGLFSVQSNSFVQFSGLYSNPNEVGLLLSVSIPMMIAVVLIKRGEQNKFIHLYYFALIFLLVILLLTDSRASIGAVFLSTIFILWKIKPKYLKYVFYSFVLFALIIFLIPVLNEFAGIYFRVGRIFENTRYDIWSMTFKIIKNNFLFGVGPDLYWTKIYSYLPVMLGSFEEHQIWWARTGTAHNFFLFKFAETGIFGFASAVYLFYAFFKISNNIEKKLKDINRKNYLISVAISSVGVGLLARAFLESTGLLTNGWITRDLPFWILFIIAAHFYQNLIVTEKKIEDI
ncbi:MAG: O-antigen ligase family protein [Bacteroidetes bacterium]|nr:O-antigen ligase family protein [Bacteroidota bacterium]